MGTIDSIYNSSYLNSKIAGCTCLYCSGSFNSDKLYDPHGMDKNNISLRDGEIQFIYQRHRAQFTSKPGCLSCERPHYLNSGRGCKKCRIMIRLKLEKEKFKE